MIIFRYILKQHALPFLFSSITLISIFLLKFLMQFADRLVGKGLSTWIIIKLIAYNLGWIVVLVIPMAVLIAVLMAFGSMAQNNEIAILKSAGISLYKMMFPPFFAAILIAILLIEFNNNVYPDSNHALKLLMQDVSRKKPTLSLMPGVFNSDMPRYSILARKISAKKNKLEDIIIYDKYRLNSSNIITAKFGVIYFSEKQKKLIMELKDGEIHKFNKIEKDNYEILNFKDYKISLPADEFTLQQTESGYRSERELSADDLKIIADSLKTIKTNYEKNFSKISLKYINPDSSQFYNSGSALYSLKHIYIKVENNIKTNQRIIEDDIDRIENKRKQINEKWVEIHKKYSIPFACIVFILIGAPLGSMTRKGGFGVAAGMSLIFFLIYWAFLIGGEKLADRDLLSPFEGMWSANFVLGILGIYLTIKSAKERISIDFSVLVNLIPKKIRNAIFK